MVPCVSALVTDERWRPALATYPVAFWDELDGLDRGDRASVKQVLTASTMPYRPMRTTRTENIPVLCRFIGASNTPVATLFRDPTGNRRFYQLTAADRMDWATINGLDYAVLWQCVSETEPAPLIPFLSLVQGEQEEQRWRDSVGAWLQDETWNAYANMDGLHRDQVDPRAEVYCTEAYDRYLVWCRTHHEERPIVNSQFGSRMAEEGFERKRGSLPTGDRFWYYRLTRTVLVS